MGVQQYKREFIKTLGPLWSTSYLSIFKHFLFFIKYNRCRSPFLAHINDYLVCSNSGYEFFKLYTYIAYIICDKSCGEQTQYFFPFCLTDPLALSGIFLCRRFFLNWIFHRSFVRFRPSKLTHPTWHLWLDPAGRQINLKAKIQQIWSPLRAKKCDKQV